MEIIPGLHLLEKKQQHGYLYAERPYDSCGHKIGRRRFLLSPLMSLKCHHHHHYQKSPDGKFLFSRLMAGKNADALRAARKPSSVIGPNVLLFQNINWKKVSFVNEINGIFSKESQLVTPPFTHPTASMPLEKSSISSLFEYDRDLESHHPHLPSADEEMDFVHSNRQIHHGQGSIYLTKADSYHQFEEEDDHDTKMVFPPISRAGRPRGSGRRRGAYGKRRGAAKGYRRGKASAVYQSSHAMRGRFQQSELSSAASDNDDDDDESEVEEKTQNVRKKKHTEKYASEPAFTSSSLSNEEALSEGDNNDEDDDADMEEERSGERSPLSSDDESQSAMEKRSSPSLQKKKGRKPKTQHIQGMACPSLVIEGDDSSNSNASHVSEEDEDEFSSMRTSSLRSRKQERPVYNTSRRARGSSRGRGGRRSLTSPNLIRLGSASGGGGLSSRGA